jgi:hypothetical protein
MAPADLPMVQRWLTAPHVAQWWGDADEQFALVRGDLDPANARAIRAYEKAGFNKDRVVSTPDGGALLMVRDA